MAGIPPEWGGGHVFIDNPDDSTMSTMLADMAAMNLQMLHTMQAGAPAGDAGAAQRAAADRMAGMARNVLQASRVSNRRERATREMQPVTRIPAAAWGNVNNVAQIRMINVPVFSGSSADTVDVVRWISRIFMLAETHDLTYNAAVALMVQGSSGGAADYIEQMRAEGKTINQIVQQLEMRYGDLCTPAEARVKCNSMPRKEGEGLPEYIDRLRSMARMACRLEENDAAMRQQMDVLVEGNIRRVLPTSVRNALEERVVNRSRMGLPPFTAREVEKECLDLEKRRDERREVAREGAGAKKPGRILRTEEVVSNTDTDSSSAEEAEAGDEGTYHLIKEIKQMQKHYAGKGRKDDPKIYKRAFRNYHAKYSQKYGQKGPRSAAAPYGARQAAGMSQAPAQVTRPPGPPNRLDTGVKRTIMELLSMANVVKGHCIQCGFEGHYMHNDACALKDKPLVDRACAKCGQGLHSADDCPKVFQQGYVAPSHLQGNQANPAQNQGAEALN